MIHELRLAGTTFGSQKLFHRSNIWLSATLFGKSEKLIEDFISQTT